MHLPAQLPAPTESIEASRNAWRTYALELEWKLDELCKAAIHRHRYVPDLTGEQLAEAGESSSDSERLRVHQ